MINLPQTEAVKLIHATSEDDYKSTGIMMAVAVSQEGPTSFFLGLRNRDMNSDTMGQFSRAEMVELRDALNRELGS